MKSPKMKKFPYIITISSEKGGVGKTTLATNLAIFLKALDEDLPVSIFSFDNHFSIDKMFAHKGVTAAGNVGDLLSGVPGCSLLKTGEYGVNYIPSSPNLAKEKSSLSDPMALAKTLAVSGIEGILIIDTRPDLDILTENALYAADRVLIPVKDMPSLENCRNIFALFDKRGLDRKSLLLLPCLIDERIKFDGLFPDQKSLLRAFAINRGYRCHDVYISKSPKVESLNTNPDGKIYAVLTHGRGTDVHGQFTRLAGDIIKDFRETKEPRAMLFSDWIAAENDKSRAAIAARLSGMRKDCLFCNNELRSGGRGSVGYYFETSDSRSSGFLDDECFLNMLKTSVFNIRGDVTDNDPTMMLLRESARESSFVFSPSTIDESGIVFSRIDSSGQSLTKKTLQFRNHAGGMLHEDKCQLHTLVAETLSDNNGGLRDAFVMVHPIDTENPENILQKTEYRKFHTLLRSISRV
jgi:hypothetical protein